MKMQGKETGRVEGGCQKLICGLYAIADSAHNPCARLSELASLFIRGGCGIIQLRMKGEHTAAWRKALLDEARRVQALRAQAKFCFIVNDDVDIALEVGADGVHVGAGDEPVAEIRQRGGDRLLIGYSAHSPKEAERAVAEGADYVAMGAVFPTKTKGPGHPVCGLSGLEEVARRVDVPLVAIGGINRSNVDEVVAAGARACAFITALVDAKDIVAETRWYVERLHRLAANGESFGMR